MSLGLKRGGSDIKSSAIKKKKKAEKLTPSVKKKVIPWIDLEEATGKGVIAIGDHAYLVIGGGGGGLLIYLYSKNKK